MQALCNAFDKLTLFLATKGEESTDPDRLASPPSRGEGMGVGGLLQGT